MEDVETITLDRFEYKLAEDLYVVYKKCVGKTYTLKHARKYQFKAIEDMEKFVDSKNKERKRYAKLLPTLTVSELNKIFSDVVVLGLTPKQLKEYTEENIYEYTLVIDENWDEAKVYKNMDEVKWAVAEYIGLTFHYDYDLVHKID